METFFSVKARLVIRWRGVITVAECVVCVYPIRYTLRFIHSFLP